MKKLSSVTATITNWQFQLVQKKMQWSRITSRIHPTYLSFLIFVDKLIQFIVKKHNDFTIKRPSLIEEKRTKNICHMKKKMSTIDSWGQFHQQSTRSFCASKVQTLKLSTKKPSHATYVRKSCAQDVGEIDHWTYTMEGK